MIEAKIISTGKSSKKTKEGQYMKYKDKEALKKYIKRLDSEWECFTHSYIRKPYIN